MSGGAEMLTIFKGALVGVANIIPGVSGGTFALVLGIYQRLIDSLSAFGPPTLKILVALLLHPTDSHRRQAAAREWQRLQAGWLLLLAAGAALAILASSRLIAFLLDEHREPTLAFFVGLILPSMVVPLGMMQRRGWRELLAAMSGCALLLGFTVFGAPATSASGGLVTLFFSGALAISAMILPGVSGSFVLMVMGEYRVVLEALNQWQLVPLGVFAAGCLVGLLAFVRLLRFLLARYHSVTMAFLIGLILGSLWVLWPFKQVEPGAKLVTGRNVWPDHFDIQVLVTTLAAAVGMACAAGINWLGRHEARHGGR